LGWHNEVVCGEGRNGGTVSSKGKRWNVGMWCREQCRKKTWNGLANLIGENHAHNFLLYSGFTVTIHNSQLQKQPHLAFTPLSRNDQTVNKYFLFTILATFKDFFFHFSLISVKYNKNNNNNFLVYLIVSHS